MWIRKIVYTRQTIIHMMCLQVYYTMKKWLCGVVERGHSSSALIFFFFWRGYWRRSANVYSSICSLFGHVNTLCHSRIATAKCSIWSFVNVRWRSFTCKVFSQTSLKSTVWWQSYLPSFPVSVDIKITWSHTNGFLTVGICEIERVSILSANSI